MLVAEIQSLFSLKITELNINEMHAQVQLLHTNSNELDHMLGLRQRPGANIGSVANCSM